MGRQGFSYYDGSVAGQHENRQCNGGPGCIDRADINTNFPSLSKSQGRGVVLNGSAGVIFDWQ